MAAWFPRTPHMNTALFPYRSHGPSKSTPRLNSSSKTCSLTTSCKGSVANGHQVNANACREGSDAGLPPVVGGPEGWSAVCHGIAGLFEVVAQLVHEPQYLWSVAEHRRVRARRAQLRALAQVAFTRLVKPAQHLPQKKTVVRRACKGPRGDTPPPQRILEVERKARIILRRTSHLNVTVGGVAADHTLGFHGRPPDPRITAAPSAQPVHKQRSPAGSGLDYPDDVCFTSLYFSVDVTAPWSCSVRVQKLGSSSAGNQEAKKRKIAALVLLDDSTTPR